MKAKGHLLVVDDEKDIALYLKQLLEDEGYPTLSAFSSQEALTIIESQKIDIMITDIRMPQMDGIELINSVLELKKNILAIVLTGHGDIDTAIEAMKKGAINYLRKPVNFDELLITIQRGLETIELREDLEKETQNLVESNKKLTKALSEIKQLKSFLPICSSCKKIRDDEGYWNRIETYIEQHTDSVFSHSICPRCTKKLYGNEAWYQETLKDEE